MTVAAIIERVNRTYLYPPDSRPAQCLLDTGLSTSETSVILGTFVLPEDEELVNSGAQIEIASELMQITAYDPLATTATVIRAAAGTTAVAHTAGDIITLSPPYTRLSTFEAVADNILTLYPSLYTVNTKNISPVGMRVFDIEDDLAVEVLEIWPDANTSGTGIDGRIVDYHPAVGGRSLITSVSVGSVWVRYRRRMGSATSETDTLADLGMDQRWVNIVMAGVAGDLLAGRDIQATQTEWVGGALQAENIPVGTRSSLAQRLAGYRTYLLDNATKEMKAEYRAKVHQRSPTQVVSRAAF